MSQSERVRTRIQALDKRLTRLRVAKSRLVARASQTERKRDTRRKILIGGAVLAALGHEGVPSMRSNAELLRWLDAQLTRPHDRAVFDLTSGEEGSVQAPGFGPMSTSARSVSEGHKKIGPKLDAHRAISSDARQKHDSESDDETT